MGCSAEGNLTVKLIQLLTVLLNWVYPWGNQKFKCVFFLIGCLIQFLLFFPRIFTASFRVTSGIHIWVPAEYWVDQQNIELILKKLSNCTRLASQINVYQSRLVIQPYPSQQFLNMGLLDLIPIFILFYFHTETFRQREMDYEFWICSQVLTTSHLIFSHFTSQINNI